MTPITTETPTDAGGRPSVRLPARRRAVRPGPGSAFRPRLFDDRRTNLAVGVFAISALAMSGCAGDDDGLSTSACDAYAALQSSFFGDPAQIGDAAASFRDAAPDSLADEIGVLVDSITSDDPDAMSAPEVATATTTIGDAVFESCEVTSAIDVDGVDYAFDGLPTSVEAGRVAVRLHNGSDTEQPHELVVVTGADGQSADELRELPPDQLMQQGRPLAVAFVETPGESATTLADLAPGSYLLICMLPVAEHGEAPAGEGPPSDVHATHGMVATLTVT